MTELHTFEEVYSHTNEALASLRLSIASEYPGDGFTFTPLYGRDHLERTMFTQGRYLFPMPAPSNR